MQCTPELTEKEVEENYKHFSERVSLYKRRSLDIIGTRRFILEKAQPLKGSILEVGSGMGYTTLALAKAGYKFISVDKDKEAFKIAALNLAYEKVLFNVKFYVMDGKSLTFANNSFRNVVIVNLFHHITGVDKILSEADRILYANGKLILVDFNERGMGIVNSVHKEEGHIHIDCGVSKDYVYSYFHGLGYEIKSYEDRCHWVLICEKRIHP